MMTYLTKNNLANNPFLFKSSTKLCNIILLYNNKRYMPKMPKGTIETIEKCVGNTCKTFITPGTPKTSSPTLRPSVEEKVPDDSLKNNPINEASNKEAIPSSSNDQSIKHKDFLKEAQKPMDSITNKVKKTSIQETQKIKDTENVNQNNTTTTTTTNSSNNNTTFDAHKIIHSSLHAATRSSQQYTPKPQEPAYDSSKYVDDDSSSKYVGEDNSCIPIMSPVPTQNDMENKVMFKKELEQEYLIRKKNEKQVLEKIALLEKNTSDKKNEFEQKGKVLTFALFDTMINGYTKIESIQGWTEEKFQYVNTLRLILDEYKELQSKVPPSVSRDLEEFNRIRPSLDAENELHSDIIKNLQQESLLYCLTPEQYKSEISRKEDACRILQASSFIPEIVLFEVIRRADVFSNNDAQYLDDNGNTIVKVECEGPVLTRNVYLLLAEKPHLYTEAQGERLKESESDQIFYNIKNGNYFLGIFKDDTQEKIIEGSDERHMNIITTFTDNSGKVRYVSVGYLTSNKDPGTIILSDKQYINKDYKEKNKEQRFRPAKQFVEMPFDSITTHKEGTIYVTSESYENHNIKEKIVTEILNQKDSLKLLPMREPQIFKLQELRNIALESYIQQINNLKNDLEKLQKDLNDLNDLTNDQKNIYLKRRENQYKNQQKAIHDAASLRKAPEEIKKLIHEKSTKYYFIFSTTYF
jgi:hypothetical protein